MVRYRCDPDKKLEGTLEIPADNPQKMEALIETAQHRMSETEVSCISTYYIEVTIKRGITKWDDVELLYHLMTIQFSPQKLED